MTIKYAYELVDISDDETYYPLGIFSTFNKALSEIKRAVHHQTQLSDHDNDVEILEIRKHRLDSGVGDSTKTAFTLTRERQYPSFDADDDDDDRWNITYQQPTLLKDSPT